MFLILFFLKLGFGETIVTTWSWWIITLPLWIVPGTVFGIGTATFLAVTILYYISKWFK